MLVDKPANWTTDLDSIITSLAKHRPSTNPKKQINSFNNNYVLIDNNKPPFPTEELIEFAVQRYRSIINQNIAWPENCIPLLCKPMSKKKYNLTDDIVTNVQRFGLTDEVVEAVTLYPYDKVYDLDDEDDDIIVRSH